MNPFNQNTRFRIFKFVFPFFILLIFHQISPAQVTSRECAKEGERCAFAGTAEVAYGAGNRWATKVATSSIQCGVAAFGGDPAENVLKTCQLTTKKCAGEGGKCEFSGVKTVNYGANGIFASRTFRDGVTCGVAAFGYDPVPNVLKQCFIGPAPEKPINEITWLGTHNAIASTYYGFFIQNSQRDSVTAQLDRGARALEIDTVKDTPAGFATGVYVCHCGAAPHSLSNEELNRFASKKENQTSWPFQLPGWTHPTPYMRFSTILKEIDKWLIANPNEIVIVLMENNSANGAQLDTEIEAAGLQTGIYRHPDDDKWQTKSELVRKNQRLILQVSDDKIYALGYRGLTGESKYATPKYKVVDNKYMEILSYGALTPPGYGNLNEYSKDKADDARTGNKLLVMGAFKSALTDELTSRSFNQYSFLNAAKAQWQDMNPKNTFYPSIIEVNQIHIGDALRFVNDLNGGPYMISSKADNIGDTSGDSWQLRFENNAAFNAGIVVTYWQDFGSGAAKVSVPIVVNSGVLNPALGVARMVNIPRNTSAGKPISVRVILYSTAEFDLYKEDHPANFVGSPVPCFKATGILTSPKGSRCE
ncbi:MAG: hypothetical protein IPG22_13835 [Acidobacteria bacterium]|nr:hypothetical protein [Acidobacteriota bacterium]